LYESEIAVKANAKWLERYWELHGAGTAQGKKNEEGEMTFAKVGRDGITAQLETAATKIIEVTNVRWHILAIIMLLMAVTLASFARAKEVAPLRLLDAVPLPGFSGDFDHFAVDEKGGRLFLAGEDHKTVEVFDLKTGRRLKRIAGFGTPHSIIYLPESDHILVADGDKGMLQILRGSDYAVMDHVDGLAGADSMRLDAPSQILYVVTGGKDVPLDYSFLGKVVAQLPAVERSDDIAFDAEKGSIYVPGGEGFTSVFQQKSADQYQLLAKVKTEPGAKTCLLVPNLARFYVAVSPGETKGPAKVLIYHVQ